MVVDQNSQNRCGESGETCCREIEWLTKLVPTFTRGFDSVMSTHCWSVSEWFLGRAIVYLLYLVCYLIRACVCPFTVITHARARNFLGYRYGYGTVYPLKHWFRKCNCLQYTNKLLKQISINTYFITYMYLLYVWRNIFLDTASGINPQTAKSVSLNMLTKCSWVSAVKISSCRSCSITLRIEH